jgi:hypothetical protein
VKRWLADKKKIFNEAQKVLKKLLKAYAIRYFIQNSYKRGFIQQRKKGSRSIARTLSIVF